MKERKIERKRRRKMGIKSKQEMTKTLMAGDRSVLKRAMVKKLEIVSLEKWKTMKWEYTTASAKQSVEGCSFTRKAQ